jgi:hypothetical protein
MDYVLEHLRKKLRREPTAEEYIGANGLNPEDYEGERIAMAPWWLQNEIERLAEEARQESNRRKNL